MSKDVDGNITEGRAAEGEDTRAGCMTGTRSSTSQPLSLRPK